MLRVPLSHKYDKRTLRVLYGQTQATPYDVQLSSGFTRTGGAIAGTATTGITGSVSAILPGLVAVKLAGEVVTVSPVYEAGSRAFGLHANFVGGDITDIPADFDRIGVWRGPGSVYELLAPVFSTANSLSSIDAPTSPVGADVSEEVYMNANAKGQLEAAAAGAYTVSMTARLIKYLSANAIIVELLV